MPKVSMIESTIKNAAKDFTKYAQIDKSFAERLVYNNGLRGHISNKALIYDLGFDVFEKNGTLSNDGLTEIREIIKSNKLSPDATWFDAIKASHQKWVKSNSVTKNKYSVFDYMINPE